jgi:Fe-Mn family superoxide dismutase
MSIQLPALPYAADALEPVISARTIEFHYGKHHQAYVTKLNTLIPGTAFETATLEDMILKSEGGIFNNAAQVWNHTFYWEGFSVRRGTAPSDKLLQMIDEAFGSFEVFKTKFNEAAVNQFGSGWAWLVVNTENKLQIVTTGNAANPKRDGLKPILTCDVWEHAYYIDYQNRRPDYLTAFWQLVDWDIVAGRM